MYIYIHKYIHIRVWMPRRQEVVKTNTDYNSGMSGLSRMEKNMQKMKEKLKRY